MTTPYIHVPRWAKTRSAAARMLYAIVERGELILDFGEVRVLSDAYADELVRQGGSRALSYRVFNITDQHRACLDRVAQRRGYDCFMGWVRASA
jgi:hypothetical protein